MTAPVRLVRLQHDGSPQWAVTTEEGLLPLGADLADLLALPLEEARRAVEEAAGGAGRSDSVAPLPEGPSLPPVDRQEVWAAGVTYQRSRQGRVEESEQSGHSSLYDHVYESPRPELFFKATPERVVTDGEPVGIRADSGWDVPEAELGLVVNAHGEIFGYVAGNDMSSRSIEGENPLFLPQAKVYDRSCALSSAVVPVWEAGDGPFDVSARIERDGATAWEAATSTSTMRRTLPELVDWLTRALEHPHGAVLLTGTGLVPDRSFTLQEGDVITITVDGIGTLTNPVVVVGR